MHFILRFVQVSWSCAAIEAQTGPYREATQ